MSKVNQVRDDNFDAEVVESENPVLVDFWAPWCGPCKMVGPLMEELAEEYDGRLKVVKVNTQESQEVALLLGVRSVPTVVLFHGNEVVDAFVGARPKVAYAKAVDKYLKKVDKKRKKEEKRLQKEARKSAVA
jgi:thioredoxin 1